MEEQECKFEVGKKYKEKNGSIHKVVGFVPEANIDSKLITMNDSGGIVARALNGKYFSDEESDYDLVEGVHIEKLKPIGDKAPDKHFYIATYKDGTTSYLCKTKVDAIDFGEVEELFMVPAWKVDE